MRRVEGVVQHYAWGDTDFIPKLLGRVPDGRPWAELWLGTHENGPTMLDDGTPLSDLTGELPYMLKVLSAVRPLSLQTHPDSARARHGFARGVYVDGNPKPELLCALTPFQALCGVRPVPATLALLGDLGIDHLARVLAAEGPYAALEGLYRGAIDPQPAIEACSSDAAADHPEAEWVRKIAALHGAEPSVAVTLLLNLVVLERGQCLRLDAGNLHAYLVGAGVELMGNSDNVIRGGLTDKHVDVDELLAVLDPTPLVEPVLPDSTRYELPEAGVALLRLDPGDEHVATGHELAVDLAGATTYFGPGDRLTPSEVTYIVVPI
jgi:mannose-6-phosphate isomerase